LNCVIQNVPSTNSASRLRNMRKLPENGCLFSGEAERDSTDRLGTHVTNCTDSYAGRPDGDILVGLMKSSRYAAILSPIMKKGRGIG
jgi:hypothetical protein